MKILIIGSGGREHAIAWKLSQNPKVEKIYTAAGNAGIDLLEKGECINLKTVDEILEFAAEKFGTKLVVVLGHSHCGAVTACVETLINPDQQFSPNLRSIVDRIRPSVYNLHEIYTANGQDMDVQELIERGTKANVRMSVSQLKHGSRILEDAVDSGNLLIVGATYDLDTGRVQFFE